MNFFNVSYSLAYCKYDNLDQSETIQRCNKYVVLDYIGSYCLSLNSICFGVVQRDDFSGKLYALIADFAPQGALVCMVNNHSMPTDAVHG